MGNLHCLSIPASPPTSFFNIGLQRFSTRYANQHNCSSAAAISQHGFRTLNSVLGVRVVGTGWKESVEVISKISRL
jgi:hypothetical protein